ncbi:MAG: alpha-galactosidase [Lachnospiraceae bacterium]|nr:alpha-galactosidase [Lachnospiraceae bacterium]
MVRVIDDKLFIIETNGTSYIFRKTDSGHMEHIYYGKKVTLIGEDYEDQDSIDASIVDAFSDINMPAPGNSCTLDENYPEFSLENFRLEFSSNGKGDMDEPFVEVCFQDGSRVVDFRFKDYKVLNEKPELKKLPSAYYSEEDLEGDSNSSKELKDSKYSRDSRDLEDSHMGRGLEIIFEDKYSGLELILSYFTFDLKDVITRSAKLVNKGDSSVVINRLMSMQLDFSDSDYNATLFRGAWAREMSRADHKLGRGKLVNENFTGTSSSKANPFFMLYRDDTSEKCGDCYGFNLIYSGNHYEAFEVNGYDTLRVVSGISPRGFSYKLDAKESLEAPEAVMTYSASGFSKMSLNMQHFVNDNIIRGKYKYKPRPVLLNSWEAAYFDINEEKLLGLVKEGKNVGVELFVMDDGWFVGRNDDRTSLGDWEADKTKLPNGLKGIADKVNSLGLSFGIWVEPEMISVNSNLYKAHKDWVLEHNTRPHSEGRNQRILDLTREEVQDFIIDSVRNILNSANISYVKWDMNRNFSDYYSKGLLPENQGEVSYRYVTGLYRCMKTLTEEFPDVLFEGCSSGGNRFDLGILSYFPQIWASDNTDALSRAMMQYNYSFGYPQSTVGAHYSDVPNHQTGRVLDSNYRLSVAVFASFGLEANLIKASEEEKEDIKKAISFYKDNRKLFLYGDFYRDSASHIINVVSKNKDKSILMCLNTLTIPNYRNVCLKASGLKDSARYRLKRYDIGKSYLAQYNLDRLDVKEATIYGDSLENIGIRVFPCEGAKIYLIDEI